MKKRALVLVMLVAATVGAWFMGSYVVKEANATKKQAKRELKAGLATVEEIKLPEPTLLYGMVVDSFEVVEQKIKPGQNLANLLSPYNVEPQKATELAQKSRPVFDTRKLAAHKKVTILTKKDSAKTAQFLVYEPNATEYIVFSLADTLGAALMQREVKTVEKTIYGSISSSLSASISEAGGNAALTSKLVDVFAWQIDFFRIQKGDNFRVIYEESLVEDKAVGIGKILAVQFEHSGEMYNAYYYDQGEGPTYFDEEGNSLRKAFLKAPLNFTRISSRYTMRRFHPVQKRWKAHLGTDYAAPTGTPIYSVGDGEIVAAGYNRGNGNYVKVKHNGTYTTQYLHMSRIAKGMKNGKRVRQGEVIGYVGSTGLATGPHLCFRFWKNNKQVDPFSIKIPPSEPIGKQHLAAFEEVKQQYNQRLASLGEENIPTDLQASL